MSLLKAGVTTTGLRRVSKYQPFYYWHQPVLTSAFQRENAGHEGVGCQPPTAFRPHHMVTQERLLVHLQLLSKCLPWTALAFTFLVLQKPCKKVPEASSTISLQALGWRPSLTLEFSEVWKHENFLMTGPTIDLEILKYFFLLLLEIYACFWHLSCSLWTLRQSIHLNFFFFLLLLAVNFPCHYFFDPLFFMYLKMSYLFQCLL